MRSQPIHKGILELSGEFEKLVGDTTLLLIRRVSLDGKMLLAVATYQLVRKSVFVVPLEEL